MDRQLERRQQELGGVISRIARRNAADLHRRFRVPQRVEGRDAARLGEGTGDVVLGRDADVLELARVELDTRLADHLVDYLVAVEIQNRQAVGLGDLIYMIGREQAGGAGHVLDDDGRVPRNLVAQVARDQARVGIEATAGGEADDQFDSLAFVEWRGCIG